MTSLPNLIESRLADAETSWSVGCFGAIAEFHWTRDEDCRAIEPMGRETSRGSITIDPDALGSDARGLAWESAGGHGKGWTQGFSLHIPSGEARMGARDTLTRIGDDAEGALYDIGIGATDVDACVVTSDAELAAALDRSIGRSIWEDDNSVLAAIKEGSPTRLFRSKAAQVRVRQRIGRSGGEPTPNGPHTHVIKNLLRTVRPHDARIPVPEGRSVVLSMYPPHPTRDEFGERKSFDQEQWKGFQALLAEFGTPGYASTKEELLAKANGDGECTAPSEPGIARVLLPQLAELGLRAERLEHVAEAWNLGHILDKVRADSSGDMTLNRAH
ncbi:MAG: hypothetical protein AAGA20_02615 [Planctomycetota bacterium]